MPELIASTYEIKRVIGSGGGGVVYIGQHVRLLKDIVSEGGQTRTVRQNARGTGFIPAQAGESLKNVR